MYERIILTPSSYGTGLTTFPDGSKSIPSSLTFTNVRQYDEDNNSANIITTVNSRLINAKTRSSVIALNTDINTGTLTENTFEFVADFNIPSNTKFYNTDSTIAKFKKEFEDANGAIRINKSFLTDNLSCVEIPDYSFQALTMKNYDYYIKIFKNYDEKILNSNILVIKSYTFKKAWILYNNDGNITNNGITKIIIDFKYRSDIKFKNLNYYSNLQDYFNKMNINSPYFDKYWLNTSKKQKYLVNKQSSYFNYGLKYTIPNYSNIPEPNKLTMITMRDSSSETYTASTFSLPSFQYLDATTDKAKLNNINIIDCEIYYYGSKNKTGQRCLTTNFIKNKSTGFFEIFPNQIGVAHYIFKNNNTTNILLDNLRYWMKSNHIYLCNAPFNNINNFYADSEKDKIYAELYIPIQIDSSIPVVQINDTDHNPDLDLSLQIIDADTYFINNHISSKYDPTNIYFNSNSELGKKIQYATSDSDAEETATPYLSMDQFISPILEDNSIRINDYTQENIKNLYEWRNLKNGDLINYDFNIETKTTTSPKMSIDNIKNIFSASNFRQELTNNIVSQIEDSIAQLSKNLALFISDNSQSYETSSVSTIQVSPKNNFFFIYFYNENDNGYVPITFTFNKLTIASNTVANNVQLMYNLKPTDSSKNLYILPCIRFDLETENYYNITFPDNSFHIVL